MVHRSTAFLTNSYFVYFPTFRVSNLSANCNLIIQKADKSNAVVLVQKDVCMRHIVKIGKIKSLKKLKSRKEL